MYKRHVDLQKDLQKFTYIQCFIYQSNMSLLLKFNTFLIVNVFNAKECNVEVIIYKKSLIESDIHRIFL